MFLKSICRLPLLLLAFVCLDGLEPAIAQTVPAKYQRVSLPPGDHGIIAPAGLGTSNTVPANPYDDSIGNLYRIDQAARLNQKSINNGVQQILTGYYAPLVFQAAEQGQGGLIQQAAQNVLNNGLGSINDTYRGMHQWFSDDLVHNLFANIGQLFGKWMTEFLQWLADSAHLLSRCLRVFLLNPNIAVNGLNGQHDDGISSLVRQGADGMYAIAVDLMLLFFIFSIWKYWADAAWRGAGDLMAPVGRLIFTAGLLLAWPTLYAFDIQISNEMIVAIASKPQDLQMMDFALSKAIEGGLIVAGNAATIVFAPVISARAVESTMIGAGAAATNAELASGATFAEAQTIGELVRKGPLTPDARKKLIAGEVFSFAATLIYTILGSILIFELMYILILKAVQMSLLTAQYMFAPVFLVCYASPDTDGYATGFVKSFVETSLWTFIWLGLFKVMSIIMYSNFNPWGKILIALGVLQIMIQVPSFLGRAQISPASEFLSGKFVFGTISRALAGVKSNVSDFFDPKKTASEKDSSDEPLAYRVSPELHFANGLSGNTRSASGTVSSEGPSAKSFNRNPNSNHESLADKDDGADISSVFPLFQLLSPPLKETLNYKDDAISSEHAPAGSAFAKGVARGLVPPSSLSALGAKRTKQALASPSASNLSKIATTGGAFLLGGVTQENAVEASWGSPSSPPLDATKNLLSKLNAPGQGGLRFGQAADCWYGDTENGVQGLGFAKGVSEERVANNILVAAFTDQVRDKPGRAAARKAAVDGGALDPANLSGEAQTEAYVSNEGAAFQAALEGSKDYIDGTSGNAFTEYLRGRYGAWSPEMQAEAMCVFEQGESGGNISHRAIGAASENFAAVGAKWTAEKLIALQNPAFANMHPGRRSRAVDECLSHTNGRAQEAFSWASPAERKILHGNLVRSMSVEDVGLLLNPTSGTELRAELASLGLDQTFSGRAYLSHSFVPEHYEDIKTTQADYLLGNIGERSSSSSFAGIALPSFAYNGNSDKSGVFGAASSGGSASSPESLSSPERLALHESNFTNRNLGTTFTFDH